MRWSVVLVGLVVSCGSQRPAPVPTPTPHVRTAREILDALPDPKAAPDPWSRLRGKPDVVLLTGPPLAWRPYWPLDRIGTDVAPYLLDAAAATDKAELERYVDAWRWRYAEPDRALARLATLVMTASDAAVKHAAHLDLIQLVAVTYDPDIATKWISVPTDYERLAAEYARLGRTVEAEILLATAPLANDERGCEQRLNLVRVRAATDAAFELRRHAVGHHLEGCLEAVNAYLCELSLSLRGNPRACIWAGHVNDLARRAALARVLSDWRDAPDRSDGWKYPADFWVELASSASRAAPVAGWERVTANALFNALVTGECDARTIERVGKLATTLPRPTEPELVRLATTLTPDDCRALIAVP